MSEEMAYVTLMPCCGKVSAACIDGVTSKKDIAKLLSNGAKRGDTIERMKAERVNEIGWTTHDHTVGHRDCDGNPTRAGIIAGVKS